VQPNRHMMTHAAAAPPPQTVNVANGWPCSFCNNTNIHSTEVCQKCGKPKTDVSAKPVSELKVRRCLPIHVLAGLLRPVCCLCRCRWAMPSAWRSAASMQHTKHELALT
jgi:hypothetical protein